MQADSRSCCADSGTFQRRTITTVDVKVFPLRKRSGPYDRLVAGADRVTVTCVPFAVVAVTVGEKVSVYVVTFLTVRTSSQRVRASASLLPGRVITFAASYAAMFIDWRRNTAFAISMAPKTRVIKRGNDTAISTVAVPQRRGFFTGDGRTTFAG